MILDHPLRPVAARVQIICIAGHVAGNAERANGVGIHKEWDFVVLVSDLDSGQIAKLEKLRAEFSVGRLVGAGWWQGQHCGDAHKDEN